LGVHTQQPLTHGIHVLAELCHCLSKRNRDRYEITKYRVASLAPLLVDAHRVCLAPLLPSGPPRPHTHTHIPLPTAIVSRYGWMCMYVMYLCTYACACACITLVKEEFALHVFTHTLLSFFVLSFLYIIFPFPHV
jgi:hypothetical protein